MVEKQFLLSDGRVRLEANLDRAVYTHGDSITVHVNVTNNSSKSVKRIEVRRSLCLLGHTSLASVGPLKSFRSGFYARNCRGNPAPALFARVNASLQGRAASGRVLRG